MRRQHLRPDEVGDDFRKQARAMDKSISNHRWNRDVIGGAMVLNVTTGFLRQEDPKGNKWKSSADKTQLGGKFSVAYEERPSGSPVTASSLRLNDTGEFMESYDVITYGYDDVVVGPHGQRNKNIALRAETDWGNTITGWGPRGLRILNRIVNKALDYIARGRKPPRVGLITSGGQFRGGR